MNLTTRYPTATFCIGSALLVIGAIVLFRWLA